MNLSIATASGPLISNRAQADIVRQAQAGAATAGAAATLSAVGPGTSQRLDDYLQAINVTPGRMAADAAAIARTLVPAMQSLIQQRPDLASVQFDFVRDNGMIKVISDNVDSSDQEWLQGQLNGNAALVREVNAFHDDAVAGYAGFAKADGRPLDSEQSADASRQADKLTGFMSLFRNLGAAAQRGLLDTTDATYYAPDGTQLDFDQAPNAAGFLAFMHSARTAGDGTATLVTPSGKSMAGILKADVFGNLDVMPTFLPASAATSIGVHEIA